MMVRNTALALLAAALAVVNADGIYTKTSPVLQVDARSYDSLIAQSNHTSILEFYAPWCGHCQNLKPAYEKAAKKLAGLAKVAAINCDEDSNKQFCGQMGVQGFPTLKIIKPGAKPGRPIVEDYQGARNAKAIVDAVVEKIPNHVTKLQDTTVDEWLARGNDTAKAILFTEKGTTSALLRAVAVDFLGEISVGQIRSRESKSVEMFGVTGFPTLVLLPGGTADAIVYSGEMKKELLVEFLSQIVPPNPDPLVKKAKTSLTKAKPSASSASSETPEFVDSASKITLEEEATESPQQIVPPAEKPTIMQEAAPPIPTLATSGELKWSCLLPKSRNCILVLLPPSEPDAALSHCAADALAHLAEIAHRHTKRKSKLFPFYAVPAENEYAATLRGELGLSAKLEIVAMNMKRGWWKKYTSEQFDMVAVEGFVDSIRLGEGPREKLPASVKVDEEEKVAEEPVKEAAKELPFTFPDLPEGITIEPLDWDEYQHEHNEL